MRMTREKAYDILGLPRGSSKEDVKRVYTTIALTNHPDQKTSSPETTKVFEEASMAYKRLHQHPNDDLVELSSLMEQFSSIFRFRMKTDSGYVYFMYNPYTGMIDSDEEDDFYDSDDICSVHKHRTKKLQYNSKWNEEKRIVEVDPEKFKEMQAKANKCAEELINEEDKAKKKAIKRKQKKLRQKEKKKLAKENAKSYESDENQETSVYNQQRLMADKLLRNSNTTNSSLENHVKSKNEKKNINGEHSSFNGKPAELNDVIGNNRYKISIPEARLKSHDKKEKISSKPKSNTQLYAEYSENSSGSETKSSDSDEPGWDEQSAFFTKALKNPKLKNKITNKSAQQNKETATSSVNSSIPLSQDIITLSRQYAMDGNRLAGTGDYKRAVELFTQAISLYNTDCRYFGNRSFCYDRLEQYDRALEDADTAIQLSSVWAKGYFRKGRALTGLKRYIDAERAFEEVLKLDKHSFDAKQELHHVRLNHLMDMGFSKELCEVALRKKTTIQLALDELLSGMLAETELKVQDVYVSDEDDADFFDKELKEETSSKQDDSFSEIDYNSLWIGNLTQRVTEEALKNYFSQFGYVTGVTAMYERRCAFVNFATTEAAKMALLTSDTVEIADTQLVVRYPDRAFNQTRTTTSKNKRECFYWRNRGCHFGTACRYLHVAANQGIDLQTVERTPYQSIGQF